MSTRIPELDRNSPDGPDAQAYLERARIMRSHALTSMLRTAGRHIASALRRASAPTASTPPWQHRRSQPAAGCLAC